MRTESQTPWLNIVEYPFFPREYETRDGWMSYVDHGRGRPVVFVHGAPTWSFCFRKLIRTLSATHRCIAPDHLGFGLSEKPAKADYSPKAQSERFADLMDYLRLEDVTLVLHDHGGPIGLDWAINHVERVRSLVLFNTWMWPLTANRPAMKLASLVGNPINRVYYRMLNASPSFIMPALFADCHRIPKATQVQYLEPFRSHREREGIYTMVESLRTGVEFHEKLWLRREEIARLPALIMWGLRDPMLTPDYAQRFEEVFERSDVLEFHGHGRFVPEESPAIAVDQIRWFLMNHEPVMR